MTKNIWKQSGACMLAWLAVPGCGAQPGTANGTIVDTLPNGVVHVRNAPSSEHAYAVLELVTTIGAVDGHGKDVFGRVADVAADNNGRIYVLDSQAAEVRVFESDGKYVTSLGGRGSGPGEFRSPYALAIDETGNVWVADEAANRYTVFGSDGSVLRTMQRPIRWALSPGELHVGGAGLVTEQGQLAPGRGVLRISTEDPVHVDTTRVPDFERQMFWRNHEGERLGTQVPFAPTQVYGPTADGVWVGHGAAYRLVQINSVGDTVRIVELIADPPRLSGAEEEEAEAQIQEALSGGFAVDRSMVPRNHPYFDDLVAGYGGEIWLRRKRLVGGTATTTYDVFSYEGHYRGYVVANIEPRPRPHIGSEYVAAVIRGELDVPQVALFRIVKH